MGHDLHLLVSVVLAVGFLWVFQSLMSSIYPVNLHTTQFNCSLDPGDGHNAENPPLRTTHVYLLQSVQVPGAQCLQCPVVTGRWQPCTTSWLHSLIQRHQVLMQLTNQCKDDGR